MSGAETPAQSHLRPRAQKILDTLDQLLSQRPLREIDVEHIAEAAGITRPRFYQYFGSKHAATAALLERTCDEVFRLHAEGKNSWYRRSPGVRPRESLLATARQRAEIFFAHRGLFLEASDLWNSAPEVRDAWMRFNRRMIEVIASTIERDRAVGIAPPGPDAYRLAESLYWMGERMLFFTYAGMDKALSPRKLADLIVQLWMRSIYLQDDPDPDS
jgi:TetR/AcrR family transcriptional regulator, ethionamide resistance regulator